jgi:hypothetical protein
MCAGSTASRLYFNHTGRLLGEYALRACRFVDIRLLKVQAVYGSEPTSGHYRSQFVFWVWRHSVRGGRSHGSFHRRAAEDMEGHGGFDARDRSRLMAGHGLHSMRCRLTRPLACFLLGLSYRHHSAHHRVNRSLLAGNRCERLVGTPDRCHCSGACMAVLAEKSKSFRS